MKFKNIIKHKKFYLLLIILNFIGIVLSFLTYLNSIVKSAGLGKFYLIPFFMVSFWLFLLSLIALLYKYLDLEIPEFLGSLAFIYCFVYGIGSFLFYPLFMGFVKGLTLYHTWNILAHGFVGLQSILFLYIIKKPKGFYLLILGLIFLLIDYVHLFYNGFLYYTEYKFPFFLRLLLGFIVGLLQAAAFYLLLKKKA